VLNENFPGREYYADRDGIYPGPGSRFTAAAYNYSQYQLRDVTGHNGGVGEETYAQENVDIHYNNVAARHRSQVLNLLNYYIINYSHGSA